MATTKSATLTDASRQVSEISGEVSAELTEIDRQLRAFVKERPVTALLGAMAAGYFLGRILRRRG